MQWLASFIRSNNFCALFPKLERSTIKMAFYSSSESYESYDDDSEDYLVDCDFCAAQVKRSNYDSHLDRVHKCTHCGNYMPKDSLNAHIQRKHTTKCSHCGVLVLDTEMKRHAATHFATCGHCNESILKCNLENHLANNHPLLATIGMIRLDKLSSAEFNKLIDEKRVYAKDGHLFRK